MSKEGAAMFTNKSQPTTGKKSLVIVVLLLAFAALSLLVPFGATGALAAPGPAYVAQVDDEAERADRPISRGELAKKVSNAAKFRDDPGPQLFQDVPPTHRYYRFVNRLAMRGAVGGFPCGTVPEEPCVPPDNLPYFRPDVDALRGQAAKMIAVAAGFDDNPTTYTFQDVPPGSTFYVWVEQLASRGIAKGFPCGSRPHEPCVAPDNRPYYRLFDPITKRDAKKMIELAFDDDGADLDDDPYSKR
jgi:hypothetical protein